MSSYRAGIIGCGRPRNTDGATGFGMAHRHVAGYQSSGRVDIVAAADIDPGNLRAFCDRYSIPGRYGSAEEMLSAEQLDIVSVCLWPELHAPVVTRIAEAPVKAIHCEKPMATTWAHAVSMEQVCREAGIVLTFNHMRRFAEPVRVARDLLRSGAIGTLQRVEMYATNLYDWGTHWFDMMFFYNDEEPADWVMGQVEARGGRPIFGVRVEGQGLSQVRFRNGVMGLFSAAPGEPRFAETGACGNRLIGSEGMIEVAVVDGPKLRIRNAESGGRWKEIDLEGEMSGGELHSAGVIDLVDSLDAGKEPELSARKALQATELIYATYESSRRRGRVDLPLDIQDSPFHTLLDRSEIVPWPEFLIKNGPVTLRGYRTGGDGPSVVLAHGFTDNALCWTRLARRLEQSFDVIMVDARGHGLSDAPPAGYSDTERAADLAAVIESLDLDRPAVVGHSMGASTAAAAAATYPELIGALILEDPPWRNGEPAQRIDRAERRRRSSDSKTRSLDSLVGERRKGDPAWNEVELWPWARAKQQFALEAMAVLEDGFSPWAEVVREIRCPTLLVTADVERGSLVTRKVSDAACAANPLFRAVMLPGAGHNIRRDSFEEFLGCVLPFLAEVTESREGQ